MGGGEVVVLRDIESIAFPTAFAFAASRWQIDTADALPAYLFAWSENQVNAAMKAMRLGHVGAQRILARASAGLPGIVARALRIEPCATSNFTPTLTIASCLHESQDSRVFRS